MAANYTERRRLARQVRRYLSIYQTFLTPDFRDERKAQDYLARAQIALGQLIDLNTASTRKGR